MRVQLKKLGVFISLNPYNAEIFVYQKVFFNLKSS